MIFLRILLFFGGVYLVFWTLMSAIRTFIVPRNMHDFITRTTFIMTWQIFRVRLIFTRNFLERDQILSYLAPIALLFHLPIWYGLVLSGFMMVYYSLGITPWREAMILSGSSLFTLGFKLNETMPTIFFIFAEAIIGLILVAILISYLPTMYAAFSKREVAINLLEVAAGSPPSVSVMLLRFKRIYGLNRLTDIWETWEDWFAELEESHTSHPALIFFRSSRPSQSWVTAAGAVLDAAALTLAALDLPNDPQARLCIRAGFLALRRIADHYQLPYPENPRFPEDPISLRREEFEAVLDELAAEGMALHHDRDKAWLDFAGWRVNYDAPLVGLAQIIMAPPAPWSSDRIKDRARFVFPWAKKNEE